MVLDERVETPCAPTGSDMLPLGEKNDATNTIDTRISIGMSSRLSSTDEQRTDCYIHRSATYLLRVFVTTSLSSSTSSAFISSGTTSVRVAGVGTTFDLQENAEKSVCSAVRKNT